jgi:hypothetical protein
VSDTYTREQVYNALSRAVDDGLKAFGQTGNIDLLNVVEATAMSYLDGSAEDIHQAIQLNWSGDYVIEDGELVPAEKE